MDYACLPVGGTGGLVMHESPCVCVWPSRQAKHETHTSPIERRAVDEVEHLHLHAHKKKTQAGAGRERALPEEAHNASIVALFFVIPFLLHTLRLPPHPTPDTHTLSPPPITCSSSAANDAGAAGGAAVPRGVRDAGDAGDDDDDEEPPFFPLL